LTGQLKSDEKESMSYYNEGVDLTKANNHQEAIVYYDKALDLDKNNVKALVAKGILLM